LLFPPLSPPVQLQLGLLHQRLTRHDTQSGGRCVISCRPRQHQLLALGDTWDVVPFAIQPSWRRRTIHFKRDGRRDDAALGGKHWAMWGSKRARGRAGAGAEIGPEERERVWANPCSSSFRFKRSILCELIVSCTRVKMYMNKKMWHVPGTVYASFYLSVSINPSIHPTIHLSIVHFSFYLCLSLSIYLLVPQSIHLAIELDHACLSWREVWCRLVLSYDLT
jgi:hypothetical protein